MINERKITQAASYFIKESGGTMYHLKLMKLLFLADRDSMARFGVPITDDRMVSMDQGPVLSNTLNLINGSYRRETLLWDHWISDKENYQLSLKISFERNDLDELSNSDIEVLDVIWKEFGGMDRWALVDYTHQNCKEWKDPEGSSIPIAHEEVFRALGKSHEEAQRLGGEIYDHRKIDDLLASL